MVNSCHRILLFERNDIAELGWSLKVIFLKKKKKLKTPPWNYW